MPTGLKKVTLSESHLAGVTEPSAWGLCKDTLCDESSMQRWLLYLAVLITVEFLFGFSFLFKTLFCILDWTGLELTI